LLVAGQLICECVGEIGLGYELAVVRAYRAEVAGVEREVADESADDDAGGDGGPLRKRPARCRGGSAFRASGAPIGDVSVRARRCRGGFAEALIGVVRRD